MGQRPPGERGTATVEFALAASLLLLFLYALVDLGLLLHARLALIQAARAGLRQAVVDGGASRRAYAVIQEQLAAAGLDGPRTAVAIRPRRASYGTLVRVALAHDYRFRTPLTRLAGGKGVRLRVILLARSERLNARDPR